MVYEADGEIEDRAICRTAIMTGAATCVDVSREFPRGRLIPELYFSPLGWSPDSTKVAVVDQAYRYYRDSDLWVIDFEAGTTANLTDDDYDDNLMPGNTQPGVAIETQPTWSPDGSQIAVERMVIDEDGGLGLATLSLVDAVTGEVRDLGRLPSPPDYEMDAGSVLDLAWSPDGTQLAFTLRHMRLEPEYDGIWLMDVASGETRQLLTVGQAVELMKSYTGRRKPRNLYPGGARLVWSPEAHLLLLADQLCTGHHRCIRPRSGDGRGHDRSPARYDRRLARLAAGLAGPGGLVTRQRVPSGFLPPDQQRRG